MGVKIKKIHLKKFINKKVIISVVLVICILAGGGVIVKTKFLNNEAVAQNTVRYTSLTKRQLTSSISTSGNIKSSNTSSISSSLQTSVKEINVKLGDSVKAGDVVCVMDTTELEEEIATLQSNLEKNQAKAKTTLDQKKEAYDEAQVNYNNSLTQNTSSQSASINIVSLASTSDSSGKSNASPTDKTDSEKSQSSSSSSSQSQTPKEALAKAKSEYESALSDYENSMSNAELDNKKLELSKAQITAPFDGTITEVNAQVGETCSGSLFEIQDLNSLIVNVNVSENDISKVKVGQKATIVVDAVDSGELEGEITSVSPVANNSSGSSLSGTSSSSKSGGQSSSSYGAGQSSSGSSSSSNVTFSAEVKINTANENVKVGMNSVVNIVIEESDEVFVVPYESIVTNGKSSSIYVAEEENEKYVVKEIPVEEGMESDIYVEIDSSSLKEGMKVLGNPSAYEVGSTVEINENNQSRNSKSNSTKGQKNSDQSGSAPQDMPKDANK